MYTFGLDEFMQAAKADHRRAFESAELQGRTRETPSKPASALEPPAARRAPPVAGPAPTRS